MITRPGISGVVLTLCILSVDAPARASDIIYTPINPSFGGNSFNSAHLLGLANAQNQPKSNADAAAKAAAAAAKATSDSQRFIQMLQIRLYSSLAEQVSNAIFGDGAQPQGHMRFQDQDISWVNTGSEVRLVVTDLKSGQISEIIIPTITQ